VRSLWLQDALARDGEDDAPALRGDERADVCIVGGGYAGLWTALQLKDLRPSADVALVEGDVCGGGASGRNGGFVLTWWPKFASLVKQAGVDEARRLCRASEDAVSEIGAFCRVNGIDANYHQDGYLWSATNDHQRDDWGTMVDGLARYGEHPFEVLSPAETAQRTGSAVHVGGALERSAAIVQPALLARGLRRAAIERGVRVFERSPMTGIERAGGAPVVRTAGGRLRAARVVLAMNAWATRFAEIRRHVLVIASDVVATAPIPERLREIGWTDGLSISDSRLLVNYYRTTDDGRIAFGKGGGRLAIGPWLGARFEGESPWADAAEDGLRRTYPMLADVPVTHRWTGPIDRTRSGLPIFDALSRHPDVVYGVGFSGNGVGPTYVAGRILASMALELRDEWATCGLVGGHHKRWPPEPFRFAGGSVMKWALQRVERAYDDGREPGPLEATLIDLAPTGLVPMRVRT
jgi:glycine/D-amino acid oxidase-like deaminating enzyme